MEGSRSKSWAGAAEAHPISSNSNNTLLHFEFENGATSHKSDCAQQDEVTSDSSAHMSVSNIDSVLLHVGDSRNDKIALTHDALCDLTVASSEPSASANCLLSNSEPSLLQLSETDGALKHQSASFEMPELSSLSLPLSASVPDLPQLCENGKTRKHDRFTPTNLRSRVLGWKADCGAIISSLPNIFHARNSPKQSRYKHTSKAKESEGKPMQKEENILIPKLPHVVKPTDQVCEDRLAAVDTTSFLRSRGAAQMHSVGPQEEMMAAKEQVLYEIQWNFPELRKRSCSNIAKFALSYPLNDDKKQVPRQLRPRSSPAYMRKSLQQLCVHCQQIVMLLRLVCLLALWLCL
jgi:hypothetical protein